MLNNYFFLLFCILYVEGDVIQIEIETEHVNLCPNPILYRSDINERIKGHLNDMIICNDPKDEGTILDRKI